MNVYQLFTEDNQEYWVLADTSYRAIAYIELMFKKKVSCWFIGKSIPKNITPLVAVL